MSIKKVNANSKVVLSGRTFNTISDVVNSVRMGTAGRPASASKTTGEIVWVRNDHWYDVYPQDHDRFDILGIDEPLFSPTDAPDTFKNIKAFKAVVPDFNDPSRIVILQQPIAYGDVGRAVLTGITPVKINVTDEDHEYATLEWNSGAYPGMTYTDHLISANEGPAYILWKETGTGTKWAIVRLIHYHLNYRIKYGVVKKVVRASTPVPPPGGPPNPVIYLNVYPCDDEYGTNKDTSRTLTVKVPGAVRLADGTFATPPARSVNVWTEDGDGTDKGQVIAYLDTPGDEGPERTCLSDVWDAPRGTIRMWNDASNIPHGWHICDGTNGTPDLRNRFVVATGSSYSAGDTGGYKYHGGSQNNHDAHDLEHDHNLNFTGMVAGGSDYNVYSSSTQNALSTAATHSQTDNRPPYYALTYIMKL